MVSFSFHVRLVLIRHSLYGMGVEHHRMGMGQECNVILIGMGMGHECNVIISGMGM